MKHIVVFGGSFNPPLNSHFSLAEQLISEYKQVEKVIFVPVNCKYPKTYLIDNEHRYQMLKLVCDKNEKFDVSRIEIDHSSQLYTIETLAQMQKKYPHYQVCFTMGSDNLKELHTWKKAEELVKNYRIYVFERDEDKIDEIIEMSEFLKNNREAFIPVKNHIKSNLSSTWVREQIKNKKSIKYITPDEIVTYIQENRLYEEVENK